VRALTEATWRPYVEGAIAFHTIAGTHHTLLSPPSLRALAPILERHLSPTGAPGAAQQRGAPP
jgi:thioesterase domain-containing protein